METYKDLLERKPKETPATVTIDGVEAAVSYDLQQYGVITASYKEIYTHAELNWLQNKETLELSGWRRYYREDRTAIARSNIEMVFRTGKPCTSSDSITRYYNGESRRAALKQMEAIVKAYRAAIDAIGNAANPDFEAELDAAVRESVTGGEAE